MRKKRVIKISLLLLCVALLSGCQTVRFYSQAIGGQFEIFRKQEPISKLLASERIEPKLKQKLELILALRAFAETNLQLKADGHYLRYADLGREHVVWNIHASPRYSMEPKTWWYPFVGSAKYRGYFTEKAALDYAAKFEKKKNCDVYVEGVDAYSTLGWFKDPVLNTFVYDRDTALAETIFHELAHQRVFISGDTDFNEAFATTVGEEGVHRWLGAAKTDEYKKYRAGRARKDQFVQLIKATRQKLKTVYGETDDTESKSPPEVENPEMETAKQKVIAELRENYQALKKSWNGYSGYDEWFAGPLNNAQLNTVAAYYDLVPAFNGLLQSKEGDLEKFYAAVEKLGKTTKAERRTELKKYLDGKPGI